jgi:hypothetical protein
MELNDIPAKGHFVNEKKDLMEFLGFTRYETEKASKYSKEKFLITFPESNDSEYERYMHINNLFTKSDILSYVEFSTLLNREYGFFLHEIKNQEAICQSKNIKTVKNILVFFTVLWVLGVIIAVATYID